MKPKRPGLRYEQTPYEAKQWEAADAAAQGYLTLAVMKFREAADLAPTPELRTECLKNADMFERRAQHGPKNT